MSKSLSNPRPFELNERNETQYLFDFMTEVDKGEVESFGKSLLDFLKEDSLELGDLFD